MITPNIPVISNKATATEVKQAFDQIRAFFATIRQQGGFLSVAEAISGTYPIAANDPGADGENIDTTIPAVITGLVVTGAFNSIFLEWDRPSYSNHSYTEIHRAEVDDLGLAVYIGATQAAVYADVPSESSLSQVYYYWVRNVSTSGIVGPFNQTSGTIGSTADDPEYILELLKERITEGELYGDLTSKIDLADSKRRVFVAQPVPPYDVGDLWDVGGTPRQVNRCIFSKATGTEYSASDWQVLATVGALTSEISALEADATAKADAAKAAAEDGAKTYTDTLVATTNGRVAAVEVSAGANTTDITNINAKYTVKVDVNGYVSGYGLIATSNNGVPTSEFGVLADKFWVCSPGVTKVIPFVVSGGKTYMDIAMIKDLTVTSAKIASLAADKITAGTVTAVVKLTAPNITGGMINLGSFTGYSWPAAGLWGAHMSAEGILLGNNNNGSYIQFTKTGYMYAPGITVGGGNAYFSGVLSGRIVQAANIVANSLTVTEINGLARINGNRINVVAAGNVYVGGTANAQINHNLGRFVIVIISGASSELYMSGVNTTSFWIQNNNDSGRTVSYVYM